MPNHVRGTKPRNHTIKFMQVLSDDVFNSLMKEAKPRGIGVQEYIRAIVIPDHLSKITPSLKSKSAVRGWKKRRAKKEPFDITMSRPKTLPKPTPDQLHQMENSGPFRPIGKEPIIATQ